MQRATPYILPTLVLALFAVGYFPSFELFVQKWSASEDYTHAFFVAPIIGYMIWQKRAWLGSDHGGSLPVLLLFAVVVAFYLLSLQIQVPTFIFLATAASIVTALVYLGGFRVLKELAIPILLLLMIIPVPNQILSTLTASLQLRISEASEIVIRIFDIPMYREGNVLHLSTMSFQVVEACSGIRSLLSMTALSILLGYFTLSRIFSNFLLFLFSIPVAIVINIVRIVVLVLVYHYLGVDLSAGTAHTLTGWILFVFGLLSLYLFGRVLELWETKKTNS